MTHQLLIAGGGVGGLAAAVAATHAGWQVRLYEQAAEFSEVGAGIQLGPNATRVLARWGLESDLHRVAAFPQQLVVRGAHDGAVLARMALGDFVAARYGSPYVTVHRADLHDLLLAAARMSGVQLRQQSRVATVLPGADAVAVRLDDGLEVEGDALLGADGLWSLVRDHVHSGGQPAATGHLAYRALAVQDALPPGLRQQDVQVWLGSRMHLVAYPVRGGGQLNVVTIVHGTGGADARDWDQAALAADLRKAMGNICSPVHELVAAMPAWRLWKLHDRDPVAGPEEMVRGRMPSTYPWRCAATHSTAGSAMRVCRPARAAMVASFTRRVLSAGAGTCR